MNALLLSLPFVFLSSFALAKEPISSKKSKELRLEAAVSFPSQQVTGVAVSKAGRLFVNFPFWSDDHTASVAEVGPDGGVQPYPNAEWNRKTGEPATRWVCVQSVFIDDRDFLWVVDPSVPKMETMIKGGAKLVKFDLKTNQPIKSYLFDEAIAPDGSYLNDVRIETATDHAYLTDSGLGALIVLNLKTGGSRRVLTDHPSTKAEGDKEITVDSIKLIDPKSGKTPVIHSDGIALDAGRGLLYYHALTGETMYRIPTEALRDPNLTGEQLAAKVEKVANTPKPDGLIAGPNGRIFLTAIEKNGISVFDPSTGKVESLIEDERLQWPDSLAWGADGNLYVTASQIHRMPKYHAGKSMQSGPFQVFRVKLP